MRRAAALTGVLVGLAAWSACTRDHGTGSSADPPARTRSLAGVGFGPGGVSRLIRVQVPRHTRSLTVVVHGAPDALYALAWLETADGVEHVGLARSGAAAQPAWPSHLAAAMRARYFDERIGLMPGALHQMIRLGLFTQVYPNRPGDRLPPGPATLRIATSDPRRAAVRVEVFMPEDDGGRILPVNLIRVRGATAADPAAPPAPEALPYLRRWQRLMSAGGIDVVIQRVVDVPGTGLGDFMALSRPQEPPTSASARLALRAGVVLGPAADGALNVFVVDALPAGIGGWSLGMPGPPEARTSYSGVVVARLDQGPELARVLAHETGHFLGLFHVEDSGVSGARYPDPLDDTDPADDNLMAERGTALTPDQRFVLSRYPLLRR